jgi:ectoine hydroxylase-related dioxygenase (phytanoyl-CoA dioxygenase family)
VQFNICVDEFREDNAATQYVPGSHASDEGIANVLRGDHGPEVNHMLPEHAEVRHMLAPAGAGIIYDARMWHRACGRECNRSGGDRIAILNSVTARSFRRMRFKESEANNFMESETRAMLTQREKDAVERLCLQND